MALDLIGGSTNKTKGEKNILEAWWKQWQRTDKSQWKLGNILFKIYARKTSPYQYHANKLPQKCSIKNKLQLYNRNSTENLSKCAINTPSQQNNPPLPRAPTQSTAQINELIIPVAISNQVTCISNAQINSMFYGATFFLHKQPTEIKLVTQNQCVDIWTVIWKYRMNYRAETTKHTCLPWCLQIFVNITIFML